METINTLTMKDCLAILAVAGRPDSLKPEYRDEATKRVHGIIDRVQTLISQPRNRVRLTGAQSDFVASAAKDWAYGPHAPNVQF